MVSDFLIGLVVGVVAGFIGSTLVMEVVYLFRGVFGGHFRRREQKKWAVFHRDEALETRIPLFNWRGALKEWVRVEDAPLYRPLVRAMFNARQSYWIRKLGQALEPLGCFVNYDAESTSKDFVIDVGRGADGHWKGIPVVSEDWPRIAGDPLCWLTKHGVTPRSGRGEEPSVWSAG